MSGLDFDTALQIAEMAGCRVVTASSRVFARPTAQSPVLRVYPPGSLEALNPRNYCLIDGTGKGPGWRAEKIVEMVQWWNQKR